MEANIETAIEPAAPIPEDSGPKIFSGDQSGLEEAAAELGRRREATAQERPQAEAEPQQDDRGVTKIGYVDGRPKDQPVTLAQAAKDLSEYRKQQKEQVLREAQEQWDAYQQELGQPFDGENLSEHAAAPEQPPEPTPEERERAEFKQQAEAGLKQIAAARDNYESALSEIVRDLTGFAENEFQDVVRSANPVDAIAKLPPERKARLDQLMQQQAVVRQNLAAAQQQRIQVERADYERFAEMQDAAAERLIPELKDKAKAREVQSACLAVLKDCGFSDRELAEYWNHGGRVYLRDARAQRLIWEAAQFRAMKARSQSINKELRANQKQATPVQRPGVVDGSSVDHHRVQQLTHNLRKSGSVHDAVALMQAKRGKR